MNHNSAVVISKERTVLPDHQKLENDLLAALSQWPQVHLTVIPHLYDLSPGGPAVQRLQAIPGDLIVLSWLYPRAAFWVLNAHRVQGRLGRTSSLPKEDVEQEAPEPGGLQTLQRTIWCFDLRTHVQPQRYLEEIAAILDAAGEGVGKRGAGDGRVEVVQEQTRPRWYPVIDFGRCANCLECLNFCLFGVYGLGPEGKIMVEQPDACRPGCPACSRICPQGAIMFPQHQDPAIAGGPRASHKSLKLDLPLMVGRASPSAQADAERQQALAEKRRQKEARRKESQDDSIDHLVDEVDGMDL